MTVSEPMRAFSEMLPSGWRVMSFEQMLSEPVRNGIYKTKEFHGRGAPVVNMGELFGNDFISNQEMKRVELTEDEEAKFTLRDGDLLFARRSLVLEGSGKCSLVVAPQETTTFESSIIRARPNRGLAEPRFLFYLFASPLGRAIVASIATRTAVSGIRGSDLSQLGLPLPPLSVQRLIAGILSAYDELIENSQRRIRILEAIARTLYREWFVHFRFPGHETHPRVASPLGDIPEGWECVQLTRMINVIHGYAFQGKHFSDAPTSRVLTTPGNFRVGGGVKYDKLKFYSEEGPVEPAYIFKPMDLMVTMTDLSKAGDTLGFPAFVPKLQGFSFLHNQRIGRVVPTGELFPKHLLYCLFCDERYRHHIVGGATGISVKHTSPTRILGFTLAIPKSGKLIHAFENLARPIFQQINCLIEAAENLRRTRHLLLPRLLSGHVELKTEAA